jgi:hypothetical protein
MSNACTPQLGQNGSAVAVIQHSTSRLGAGLAETNGLVLGAGHAELGRSPSLPEPTMRATFARSRRVCRWGLAAALAGLAAGCGPTYDVLIRGGTLLDGTGAPGQRADLAIRGDGIAAIGEVRGRGRLTIEASGLVVAPGFFDLHSHSEYDRLADGHGPSFSLQGITTEIYMRSVVRAAMAEGALGVSSGLSDVPNIYMSTGELVVVPDGVPTDALPGAGAAGEGLSWSRTREWGGAANRPG